MISKELKEKILHDLKKIAEAVNQLIEDLDEVGNGITNE